MLKDWRLPTSDEVATWYVGLEETASKVKEDMICPTTVDEEERIRRMVAAAQLSQGVGSAKVGSFSRAAVAPRPQKCLLRKGQTVVSRPPSLMPEGLEDQDDEDRVPLAQLRSMGEAKAPANASSMMDGSLSNMLRPMSPTASVVAGSHTWDVDIFSSADEGEREGCILIFLPCYFCRYLEILASRLILVLFIVAGKRSSNTV